MHPTEKEAHRLKGFPGDQQCGRSLLSQMAEGLVGHFGCSRYRASSVCFAMGLAGQEQRWYREFVFVLLGEDFFIFGLD
jgi:hypothetical protein